MRVHARAHTCVCESRVCKCARLSLCVCARARERESVCARLRVTARVLFRAREMCAKDPPHTNVHTNASTARGATRAEPVLVQEETPRRVLRRHQALYYHLKKSSL